MSRPALPLVVVFLVVAFAGGCFTSARQIGRLASAAVPGSEDRAYCRMAREQGWCSPQCRRQPSWCGTAVLQSCGGGLCWWKAGDGTLLVTYHGTLPAADPGCAP